MASVPFEPASSLTLAMATHGEALTAALSKSGAPKVEATAGARHIAELAVRYTLWRTETKFETERSDQASQSWKEKRSSIERIVNSMGKLQQALHSADPKALNAFNLALHPLVGSAELKFLSTLRTEIDRLLPNARMAFELTARTAGSRGHDEAFEHLRAAVLIWQEVKGVWPSLTDNKVTAGGLTTPLLVFFRAISAGVKVSEHEVLKDWRAHQELTDAVFKRAVKSAKSPTEN